MSSNNKVNLRSMFLSVAFLLYAVQGAGAAGDATKGADIFQRCQLCHTAQKGVNKVGPSLYGVVGRPAGSIPNFEYSDAMKASAAKGLVWTKTTSSNISPTRTSFSSSTSTIPTLATR